MFFILSKLFIYFIYPITWVIVLCIAGLIVKDERRKRRLFKASFITLIIFSNPFLFSQWARRWDFPPASLPGSAHYTCAILLGGFTGEDNHQQGYFTGGADRFIEAAELKDKGTVSHILMTGGNPGLLPTQYREADWVSLQIKNLNIPDSCIFIEHDSRNSFENAQFSKRILDSAKLPPPYLLVTSAYHMRRAYYIFRKMGVEVIPFPCNYVAGRDKTSFSSFIPSAGVLTGWEVYIKEMIGLIAYHFKGKPS